MHLEAQPIFKYMLCLITSYLFCLSDRPFFVFLERIVEREEQLSKIDIGAEDYNLTDHTGDCSLR